MCRRSFTPGKMRVASYADASIWVAGTSRAASRHIMYKRWIGSKRVSSFSSDRHSGSPVVFRYNFTLGSQPTQRS